MSIDAHLKRAIVALELALADPGEMEPMHRNALNLAIGGVLAVQHGRAKDALEGKTDAGPARVEGDPKF